MGTLFALSKSATSTALDISEIALLLFGIVLTAGLIGEYAKSERWKKHVKIFEMLVIIGVAGELFADGGIFLFSTYLQTIAEQEIADLTKVAGTAKASAEAAASAASRAETAANDLQNQLLFEGPREKLLGRAAKSFVDAMRPFAGQKIEIRINPSGIHDPKDAEEMRGFVSSIKFFLGQVSGWFISEAQGDNGWGITLAVRRKSSLATRNAANALASAFVYSGMTDMNKQKPVARVVDAGSVIDRENGPPDTIVLYVGRHP